MLYPFQAREPLAVAGEGDGSKRRAVLVWPALPETREIMPCCPGRLSRCDLKALSPRWRVALASREHFYRVGATKEAANWLGACGSADVCDGNPRGGQTTKVRG